MYICQHIGKYVCVCVHKPVRMYALAYICPSVSISVCTYFHAFPCP